MDNILLGLSRFMIPIPRFVWRRQFRRVGSAHHLLLSDFCLTRPVNQFSECPSTMTWRVSWPASESPGARPSWCRTVACSECR